jgi:hypothetical protein
MKACKFFVLVVAVISAATAASAQGKAQTIFNLEENVAKTASIPDAVIAVLKSDKRVDACFQEKGKGANEAEWFEASEIDLNADRRADLIIKAKDACLYGANQGPFWIFQNAADGYREIFSASGLQLAVLPKKANSFNQIKISKAVALKPSSRIFSFKNGKYQPLK